MSIFEFERLLEAAMPSSGRTAITLTEIPANESELTGLLDRAIMTGNRRAAPLTEIHLPLGQFRNFGTSFWRLPIEDTGPDGVVRLVFDAQSTHGA